MDVLWNHESILKPLPLAKVIVGIIVETVRTSEKFIRFGCVWNVGDGLAAIHTVYLAWHSLLSRKGCQPPFSELIVI